MALIRGLALLLVLLCGRASAQGADARRDAVVRAWQATDEPLRRAALVRLAWERAAADPRERSACAALADATPPPGRALLRRLAAPPPLDLAPVEDAAALDALLAAAPADPLEEAARTLRLVALVDAGPGPGEALLARREGSTEPLAQALRRLAATRAALDALRPLLELAPAPGRPEEALDQALDLLLWHGAGRGAGASAFEREVEACGLAAIAERTGRPWLAHALLAPIGALDDRVARATSMAAQARLREVVEAWRGGASATAALERLAPVLRLADHPAARALEAGLRRSAALAPTPPPAAAAWDGWGQDERLAALDAALCAGARLDAVFPPDAPVDERGERPTLGAQLEAAGWAAVPLLVARADDPALLRRDGQGPLGLGRVGDLALAALGPWGVPFRPESPLDQRRAELDAWWSTWRDRGPVRCAMAQRERPEALRLVRLLGAAAAPIVSDALGRAAPAERGPWLDAAAALGDPAFLPALAAAARSGRPELALAGARGLAALGDEAERAEAAWLARVALEEPALDACAGLALLRRLEPALAARLERDALASPGAVAFLLRDRGELDARLALLRLVALRRGAFAADDDDAANLAASLLDELSGRAGEWTDRREAVERATALLLRDAPAWSRDPGRRAHAVVTALLLGPDAALALAALPALDPRAVVADALADPTAARHLRAGLGPRAAEVEGWLRTWLGDEAAARLAAPNPAHLLVGEVSLDPGLPDEVVARARALRRAEVTGADLLALVRAALAAGPGLHLRLLRPAWGAWRLELTPRSGPAPGLSAVLHRAGGGSTGSGAAIERAVAGALDARAEALVAELVVECRGAPPGAAQLQLLAAR